MHTRLLSSAALAAILAASVASQALASDQLTLRLRRPGAFGAVGPGDSEVLGPGGARGVQGEMRVSGEGPGAESAYLTVTMAENGPGCGTPVINVPDSTFSVTWPADCLEPGEAITLNFSTAFGPLRLKRAYWTDAGGDSIDQVIAVEVPSTGRWSIPALVSLLGAGGAIVLLRRRGSRA